MHQPSPPYRRHRIPGEIISHAGWRYYRFLLSRTDGAPSPSRVNLAPAPVAGYLRGGRERLRSPWNGADIT
jgi:hypothetical protein